MHCCIVNFWIVYHKLAQPTEPERLGNSQTNRAPFIFIPSVPVPSVINFVQNSVDFCEIAN